MTRRSSDRLVEYHRRSHAVDSTRRANTTTVRAGTSVLERPAAPVRTLPGSGPGRVGKAVGKTAAKGASVAGRDLKALSVQSDKHAASAEDGTAAAAKATGQAAKATGQAVKAAINAAGDVALFVASKGTSAGSSATRGAVQATNSVRGSSGATRRALTAASPARMFTHLFERTTGGRSATGGGWMLAKVFSHATAVVRDSAAGFIQLVMASVVVLAMLALAVGGAFAGLASVTALFQQSQSAGAGTAFAQVGEMVDDYPYKHMGVGGISPLGYAYGNCTDFVAWRINRDAGVTKEPWQYTWGALTPGGGDGFQWGEPQSLPGWTTTTDPVPGDIVSVPAGLSDWGSDGNPYGHVAYIAQVFSDGSIVVENYGYGHYYLFQKTKEQIKASPSLGVVIRHNPANVPTAENGGAPVSGDAQTPEGAKAYAKSQLGTFGWGNDQWGCLEELWTRESSWRWNAENPSSQAYGIAQALPGNKMDAVGSDWRTNAKTQITWGLGYIAERYVTPCNALSHHDANNWY